VASGDKWLSATPAPNSVTVRRVTRQLSLFTAGLRPPAVTDLEGLLCGPAHLVQRDDGARISVVVTEQWRAEALQADLAVLSLDGGVQPAAAGGVSVRTPFDPRLLPLARRWTRGAHVAPPPDLVLDGGRLRWWLTSAGSPDPVGWLLRLNPTQQQIWATAGAALAAAGLSGVFLGPRGDGPAYRLTGKRRLSRLRELVGDPPASAPPDAWPEE
jgi:hypothetical protein